MLNGSCMADKKEFAEITKDMFKVLVLVPLLLLSPTHCDDDVLELFRTSCPYNNFCTMDSLKDVSQLNDTRYTPCCLDCFCDEACHAFRDCCPDVHSFLPQQNATDDFDDYAPCVSIITPTEFAFMDPLTRPHRFYHYRMFNTCPSDYKDIDGIVDKCEEVVYSPDRRYEDAVIVSGPNNVMYRNIYCAMCRGATDVTRWELNVKGCQDNLESVRLEASKMAPYIMQSCTLMSSPPDSLRLNSRFVPCWRDVIDDCHGNLNYSEAVNETFIAGCENGPFMPYSRGFTSILKNALCYRCNNYEEPAPDLCLHTQGAIPKSSVGSLSKLFDTKKSFSKPTGYTECRESQIMDHYANECRTLYCLPFKAASYGTCQEIATPLGLSVKVLTAFWTSDTILVRHQNTYNESLQLYYANRERRRFQDLNCIGISVYTNIFTQRDTDTLMYVLVESHIEIDEKSCTIEDIGNVVRNQASITESWIIDDEVVEMKGQHTFFHNADKGNSRINVYTVLFQSARDVSLYFINEFVACPYLEIDLEWYNKILTKLGDTDTMATQTSLSMKTKTLRGMYALSENKLAVCVGQYLYLTDTANRASLLLSSDGHVIVFLVWFCVFVVLNI